MFSKNTKFISVIDIGSTKIVCLIAKITPQGLQIVGIGNNLSEGIKYGIVNDVKLFRARVTASILEAEKQAKTHIDSVAINVANPFLKSYISKIYTQLDGRQILANDISIVQSKAAEKIDLNKNEILYIATLWHDVDEMEEVLDPEYIFSNTLTSHVSIITTPIKYLINLTASLIGCQIKISNFFIGAYASNVVCASNEEMKDGCIVVDIGGSAINYSIVKFNSIINAGTIPLGGFIITKDIAKYFSLGINEAERIKIIYGQLSDFNQGQEYIEASSNGIKTVITLSKLNQVICARFEEMIKILLDKILKYQHISNCIIFTGGASQMIGLENFIYSKFDLKSKVVNPFNFNIQGAEGFDPTMSTALGMLKLVYSGKTFTGLKNNEEKFSIYKAWNWLKKNF